jgi:hypothetical protein
MNTFCPAELLVNHVFTLDENNIYSTKLAKHGSMKVLQDKKYSSEDGRNYNCLKTGHVLPR